MGRLTKQQERALFIAEFVRRLRAAAPGERVYMRVGDVFKDADVIDIKKWQAARRKAARRKNARRKDAAAVTLANRVGGCRATVD